jgi:prepilin-type N-terminal cleavage/methylation domain-containing protein
MPRCSNADNASVQGFCHIRRAHERAFTLIELLVVMIIVAILMAIAIPTFLTQKSNAVKTKAMQNIEAVQHAVEACALDHLGSYTTCAKHADLVESEPTLKEILDVWSGQDRTNGEFDIDGIMAGKVDKDPDATKTYLGYVISTWIMDGDQKVFFSLVHMDDGRVVKACGAGDTGAAAPGGGAPSFGSPVAGSRTCPDGRW